MRLKRLLFIATIVLFPNIPALQAQDLKILVDKKGKVGYADRNGNEVIKCQYESGQPFSNGVAVVTKSGKYGIIDATGKVVLPLSYTQISPWYNGLLQIKNGKKIGLADSQGKIVLPVNYSLITKPNCYGKALVAIGGKATSNDKKTYMANAKYGIIDDKGNVLVVPKYKGLYEFSFDGKNKYPYYEGKRLEFSYHNTVDTLLTDCSYLGFSNNGFNIFYAGILDGSGKELVKTGLYSFVMQPQSDMVRYYNIKKKQTLCGYHDIKTGKGFQTATFNAYIDSIKFWSHGDFIKDIAPVNGNSWSFIDKTGKTLRSGYTSILHSKTTGLWAAKNSAGTWDVLDEMNNDIPTLSNYGEIKFPANERDKEIFSVKKEGKYGCITRAGDIVIPFNYEDALSNSYDFVPVKQNGCWGILSANNDNLIPCEYVDLNLPTERDTKHFWVKKSDGLLYHLNLLSNKISSVGYKVAHNFKDGMAFVVPKGMVVEDTPINRAQIYPPHTSKKNLDAVDMSKMQGCYVNIINDKDEMVFDFPVSTMYKDTVKDILIKQGNKMLSDSEKKAIILDVTRENRTYDLDKVISENEWNY